MNTFPDVRTLTLTNFLSLMLLSLLMLYILKRHKTYPGFGIFTAGALINSTGFIMIALRSYIPDFFSVIIGNTLIIISTYSILWAIYSFCSKKYSIIKDIITISIFLLFFVYFTYLRDNISIRIIVLSVLSAYIGIRISYVSLKELKNALNTIYLPLSGSSFFMSVTHIYRVFYYISGNITESNFMNSALINSVLLIVNFCLIFLIYTSFIVLNSYRADLELRKSRNDIETLQDLLPICSHCHKIRDDKGYWEKIDYYMQKNTGFKFSHGLCPECTEKYYSEYIDLNHPNNHDLKK